MFQASKRAKVFALIATSLYLLPGCTSNVESVEQWQLEHATRIGQEPLHVVNVYKDGDDITSDWINFSITLHPLVPPGKMSYTTNDTTLVWDSEGELTFIREIPVEGAILTRDDGVEVFSSGESTIGAVFEFPFTAKDPESNDRDGFYIFVLKR